MRVIKHLAFAESGFEQFYGFFFVRVIGVFKMLIFSVGCFRNCVG